MFLQLVVTQFLLYFYYFFSSLSFELFHVHYTICCTPAPSAYIYFDPRPLRKLINVFFREMNVAADSTTGTPPVFDHESLALVAQSNLLQFYLTHLASTLMPIKPEVRDSITPK